MADNVKIEQQLNKLLKERVALLQQANSMLQSQADLMSQLSGATSDLNVNDDFASKLADLSQVFEDGAESAEDFGTKLQDAAMKGAQEIDKNVSGFERMTSQLKDSITKSDLLKGAVLGVAGVFVHAFQSGLNIMKALGGVMTSMVKGAWDLGKAIIKLPFNLMSNLVEEAKSGYGGTQLAQAFEDVRKEFGSFKQSVSKDVIASARSMRGELSNTGLSTWRVFGQLHERLAHFTELAKAMGPVFEVLGHQIAMSAEEVGAYQKGLGLAGEDMKTYGQIAIRTGRDLTEVLRETANYTLQMSDDMGMSQKLISKDMAVMAKDVAHFGNLTAKEMAKAAVYTRSLGIEVSKLGGIIDKYDNFETAAEGVSHLAANFGLSLDTFKLMQEQNPAARIDMLRKSFFAAGNDVEKMTRQQVKLLSQYTGLDEEATRLAFSQKNVGKSYEDISKSSNKAEKNQLSQAEAMSKLADSIERLVREGQFAKGGFFDQFIAGFQRGIKMSPEFLRVMFNIRKSLMIAMQEGIRLGRAFVKIFPGVKEVFGGLAEFFAPARFRQLFGGVRKALDGYQKDLKEGLDPGKAAGTMSDRLIATFKTFFGTGSAALKKISAGFFTFFSTIVKGFAHFAPIAVEKMAGAITKFTEWLADPQAVKKTFAPNVEMGPFNALVASLKLAFDKLKEKWPLLRDALAGLFSLAFDKTTEWLKNMGKRAMKAMTKSLFQKEGIDEAVKEQGEVVSKSFAKLGTGGAAAAKLAGIKIFGGLLPGATLAASLISVNSGIRKFGKGTADAIEKEFPGKDGKAASKMGAAGAGLLQALTLGLIPDDLSQKIGNSLASLAQTVINEMTNQLGEAWSKNIQGAISSGIDVAGGLGTMMGAIFDRDGDKFKEGFKQSASALPGLLWDAAVALIRGAAVAAGYGFEIGAMMGGSIIDGFGEFLSSEKNLGPVVNALGDMLSFAGKAFKIGGKQVSGIFEWMVGRKSFDAAMEPSKKELLKTADWLRGKLADWVNKFKNLWSKMKKLIPEPVKLGLEIVYGLWKGVDDWFKRTVFDPLKENFSKFVTWATKPYVDAWNMIKSVWIYAKAWFDANVLDPMKMAFDTWWNEMGVRIEKGKLMVGRLMAGLAKIFIEPFLGVGELLAKALGKDELMVKMQQLRNMLTVQAAQVGPAIEEGAKKGLESESPSKVMIRIGKNVTDGMMIGMKDFNATAKLPVQSLKSLNNDLKPQVAALGSTLDKGRAKVVDLKTSLDNLEGGPNKKTIKIKRSDYEMTFNLNVTMDAGNVERALITNSNSKLVINSQ